MDATTYPCHNLCFYKKKSLHHFLSVSALGQPDLEHVVGTLFRYVRAGGIALQDALASFENDGKIVISQLQKFRMVSG